MEVYAVVFCFLAALTIVELYIPGRDVKLGIGIACVVVLTLVAGLRWETGNDWPNYLDNYRFGTSIAYNAETFEVGYRAIVVASRQLGLSYTAFLLVTALFSNSALVYVFARLGPRALLSLLYFTSYFLGLMGTQRQYLAIAVACVGLLAIYDRRRLLGITLIGFAMLFHVTAVVCLAVLAVPRRAISWPAFLAASVVAGATAYLGATLATVLLSSIIGDGFIASKLLAYTLSDTSGPETLGNIGLASLKRGVLALFFAVMCRQPGATLTNFVLNMYLLSVGLFFMFVGFIPILALRIGLYFSVFEIFLVYTAIRRIGGSYWRELFLSAGIILSAARLYWSIFSAETPLFVPYKSVLQTSDHARFLY